MFWQSLSTKHRTKSLTHQTGNYPVSCFVSRPSVYSYLCRSLDTSISSISYLYPYFYPHLCFYLHISIPIFYLSLSRLKFELVVACKICPGCGASFRTEVISRSADDTSVLTSQPLFLSLYLYISISLARVKFELVVALHAIYQKERKLKAGAMVDIQRSFW